MRPPSGIMTGQSRVDDPDPEIAGDVGGGEDGDDARRGPCSGGVDAGDIGPGVVGEAQGGVQHAREAASRRCSPGRPEREPRPGTSSPGSRLRPAEGVPHLRPAATFSMASRIFTYPVQRQRWAPRWRAMSCLVRAVPFLSIWALARMTMPGMQKPHWRPPHAAKALGVAPAFSFVDALQGRDARGPRL